MDDPPAAPDARAPAHPPSRSRNNSLDAGSQFSEHNPLQDDDPSAHYPAEPKKPKAVALHGWQRTVGVDEDFDPTIPVCLGAPGTGLFTVKAGQNNPAAGVGPLGAAVVDLGNAKVTREDRKEAKSLRLQPAAPDAAPLPYPRVAAVDTASESSSEESTDDDDPTGGRKEKQRDRQSQFETSSSASSDMSFLVNAGSGAFLGNRGTFGRNIDPRIPATVGEERLYNSLAQYFGKSRINMQSVGGGGGGGGGGGSAGDAESAGGESRLSDLSGAAGRDKELLLRQGSGAGSSSTPLGGKAAGATPASTTNSTTLSTSGGSGSGSGSGSTMNTNNSQTASVLVDHHQHPKKNGSVSIRNRNGEAAGGVGGRAGEGESKRREGASNGRGFGGGAAVTEAMVEEGRLAKQASGEGSVQVEPTGRRLPKCRCLRLWPWKILSGVVTVAGLVAVVVVIVLSTEGDSSNETRRRLLAPQLLTPDGGGAPSAGSADVLLSGRGRGGGGGGGCVGGGDGGCGKVFGGVDVGVGGAVQARLGHSRRILSVDGIVDGEGVVDPVAAAVAGDGGAGTAVGTAAAGDAGAAAAAAAAAARAGAAGASSPQLAGEPPGRARSQVVVTTAVDGRDKPIRARARVKPAR